MAIAQDQIDHAAYPKSLRCKEDVMIHFIIRDANEAIAAMPNGHKAGYYADEINYCASELHRRRNANR